MYTNIEEFNREAFLQVLLPIAMQFSVYKIEVFIRERSIDFSGNNGAGQMLSFKDNGTIHNDDPFLKQQQPVYDLRIKKVLSVHEMGSLEYQEYEEVSNLATMSSFDPNFETTEIRFLGKRAMNLALVKNLYDVLLSIAMDLEQVDNIESTNTNFSGTTTRIDFTKFIPPSISSWFHPSTTTLASSVNDAIAHEVVEIPSNMSFADSEASSDNNTSLPPRSSNKSTSLVGVLQPADSFEDHERTPPSSAISSGSKIAARLEMLRRKASEDGSKK